jgi:glycerophosphoryl diester phosphodiesterase
MGAVATRIPSLLKPPIGFAHRGARAHAPENTLEAFRLASRLGATGIETDAWLTLDGEVVLDHDGTVRRRLSKIPIRSLNRDALPDHVPTLRDLYEAVGTDLPVSIDVKDPDAAEPILAIVRSLGDHVVRNTWLCHHQLDVVASWRRLDPSVRLVDSTRLKHLKEGPERRAARLVDLGVDASNMPCTEWTGGLTTLFHRFERYAFAWDAQFERLLAAAIDMGVDAVYSDWVDRMAAALTAAE